MNPIFVFPVQLLHAALLNCVRDTMAWRQNRKSANLDVIRNITFGFRIQIPNTYERAKTMRKT
jgi:hypothetical protein